MDTDEETPLSPDDASSVYSSAEEKEPRGDAQSRAWCFTAWTRDQVDRIRSEKGVKAMVVGIEKAPTTGKEHFQGYVRFETNHRFYWWKNQFPGMRARPRIASEVAAANYCRKEGNVIIDFGTEKPVKESTGDVTEDVLDMLESKAPLWQVYKKHRKFFFHNSKKITEMEALFNSWRECDFNFVRDS